MINRYPSLINASVEDTPRRLHRFLYPPSLFANEVQEPRSPASLKAFGASQVGTAPKPSFRDEIDHQECRRLAASCRRLAKTAPSSFLAAKLEEMAKKWLEVAAELEEVEGL